MTTDERPEIRVGAAIAGERGRRIGTVDAVFSDYLLVRTSGLVPVDLYIPRPDVTVGADRLWVSCSPDEAYARWHRPLKRAPHAEV
jgi:hypothetical protein